MRDFEESWKAWLDKADSAGRRRSLRVPDHAVTDFASNDYLGLARHPLVIARAREFLEAHGGGARASRLVTGNLAPYDAIEAKLARVKGAEAALVLVSGFQANSTILPAILDESVLGGEPLLFADRLVHASMIQGFRAAGLRAIRFHHNDLGHLQELLARHRGHQGKKIIVTETIFSMDGDRADLPGLLALAAEYDAFLYLDEAHATGMFGEQGFGLACHLAGPRCLVMGTFSKALGSFGAYAVCTRTLRDFLINRCTGLIYATALPPPVLGAIDAALDLVPTLGDERARALSHAERFRRAMAEQGHDTGASDSQIVPVILGSETRAVEVARALEAEGILAVAIRPPTVPQGTSRIRFAFSARHSDEDVEKLIVALTRIIATMPREEKATA